MPWEAEFVDKSIFDRRMKRLEKKHSDVIDLLYHNLKRAIDMLNMGVYPRGKWIHQETMGIKALTQGNKTKLEARMYIYICNDEKKVFLLTVGTKQRQSEDIKEAEKLLQSRLGRHG